MEFNIEAELGRKVSLNVGVITLGNSFKDLETIRRRESEMVELIRSLGATSIPGYRLVLDHDSLDAVITQFQQKRVHALVIIFGSYSPDEYLLKKTRS